MTNKALETTWNDTNIDPCLYPAIQTLLKGNSGDSMLHHDRSFQGNFPGRTQESREISILTGWLIIHRGKCGKYPLKTILNDLDDTYIV